MLGHLLALAIPAIGVLIVFICATSPTTKPGTSTKPEGGDHRLTENSNNA